MFIYAEFEMFFLKKDAQNISRHMQNVQNVSCLSRDFGLVMEIWFNVLEIHWSKCVRTLVKVAFSQWMKIMQKKLFSKKQFLFRSDANTVFDAIAVHT